MSEAFPAELRGLRVSRAGEGLTLGEWMEDATLRPLVRRTARCRLPEDLTLDPGSPRMWVLRLPAATVVTRTSGAREGLAASSHWASFTTSTACASWPSPGFPSGSLPHVFFCPLLGSNGWPGRPSTLPWWPLPSRGLR